MGRRRKISSILSREAMPEPHPAKAQAVTGHEPAGSFAAPTLPIKAVNPVTARALQHLSIDLRNLDLTLALQRVCDQAEISYVLALQGYKTQRVTLALREVPLDQALIGVLRFNYYIDIGTGSRTSQPSVRMAVANVTAKDLMGRLLKQSRYPLSYWIENDVFAVGPRDNTPK